jgi:hypothetical protein
MACGMTREQDREERGYLWYIILLYGTMWYHSYQHLTAVNSL